METQLWCTTRPTLSKVSANRAKLIFYGDASGGWKKSKSLYVRFEWGEGEDKNSRVVQLFASNERIKLIMIIEKRAGMKPAIYPRNSLFFSYLFTRILNLATSLPNFLSNYTKTFTKDNHTTWNPLRIIKMCRNLINYFGTIFTTVQFLIIVKVWYFLNKHLKYTKNL